jgi:hypothetical protein
VNRAFAAAVVAVTFVVTWQLSTDAIPLLNAPDGASFAWGLTLVGVCVLLWLCAAAVIRKQR